MKYFSTFLVASLAICVHAAIDKEKAKQMAVLMLNYCKTQEGGTDADVERMMNLQFPESAAGECMLACVHEKLGIFTNGVFDSELFLAISEEFANNNPAYIEAAKAIAAKCGTVTGSRCDQAVAFDKCMEAEIKERNLDPQMI